MGLFLERGRPGGRAGGGQTHLPRSQAAAAEQVPAGLDPHVLVPLGADLAELKGGVHGPVQLQLLLPGEERDRWVRPRGTGRKSPPMCPP